MLAWCACMEGTGLRITQCSPCCVSVPRAAFSVTASSDDADVDRRRLDRIPPRLLAPEAEAAAAAPGEELFRFSMLRG